MKRTKEGVIGSFMSFRFLQQMNSLHAATQSVEVYPSPVLQFNALQ